MNDLIQTTAREAANGNNGMLVLLTVAVVFMFIERIIHYVYKFKGDSKREAVEPAMIDAMNKLVQSVDRLAEHIQKMRMEQTIFQSATDRRLDGIERDIEDLARRPANGGGGTQ